MGAAEASSGRRDFGFGNASDFGFVARKRAWLASGAAARALRRADDESRKADISVCEMGFDVGEQCPPYGFKGSQD